MTTAAQHIRQAAAHEHAAVKHEGKYEEQMKAAGSEMYTAFTTALKGAEEFKGRKLDDKAVLRIYQSTKPRPWWDSALKEAKFASALGAEKIIRQKAAYLIQWHVDIDAAKARRATGQLQQAAAQKRLRAKRDAAARSMTSRSKGPSALDAAIVTQAAANAADGSRPQLSLPGASASVSVNDLLGETHRIQSGVRKVPEAQREEVLSILKAAARDIERYVP